jgi:hypothetical protein
MAQEVENGMVGSKRPCGRAAHCMYASGSEIYVSGGLAADGKKGIHSLEDVASFDATTWRRYVPKVVSQRHRQGATRLLAKLQGLDDHSSSRLLESMSAFKGKAREVYDELLNDPFATLEENEEIKSNDDGIVVLSPELSAQVRPMDTFVSFLAAYPSSLIPHRLPLMPNTLQPWPFAAHLNTQQQTPDASTPTFEAPIRSFPNTCILRRRCRACRRKSTRYSAESTRRGRLRTVCRGP